MALTIHFDKDPSEAIEQALGTEARYIIDTYNKGVALQKTYGDAAAQVIADCRKLGASIVENITMILSENSQRLLYTTIYLKNGLHFSLDAKYSTLRDEAELALVDSLISQGSPRAFKVSYK